MEDNNQIDDILAREQQLGMASTLTVRVNAAEKQTLTQAAAKMRLSVSAMMRMATLEWLEDKYPEFNTWYYYNLQRMTISDKEQV